MAILDWPANERPREKLLAQGAEALSDAELLAIFLRVGVKGKTCVDLARNLLNEFKGLRGLLEAPKAAFCACHGLGAAKYVQLQATLEMGRRYLYTSLEKSDALENTEVTRNYLMARMRHYQREVFSCLFLDTHHHIIAYEELFYGTVNSASIYPREVVKRALHHNACAVILAHNHPSGTAEPSLEDRQITQHLKDALALVEIRVLDHMIVGDSCVVSFAQIGLL